MNGLLVGYFGAGNVGDEGYLHILAPLQESTSCRWVVLSRNVGDTKKLGLSPVPAFSLPAVLSAIRSAKVVIFPGGNVLQNATSSRSLFYYLFLLRVAHTLHKPVIFLSQGVGPLFGNSTAHRVIRQIQQAKVFCARDDYTYNLLVHEGFPTGKLRRTADLSFLLPPSSLSPPLPPKSYFVVCLKSGTREKLRAFHRLLSDSPYPLLFCPFHPADVSFHQEIASRLPHAKCLSGVPSPEEAKGIVFQSVGVIGERLHSLYFAYEACVPFTAFSSDPKIQAFCEEVHFPCYPWGSSQAEHFNSLFQSLLTKGQNFDKLMELKGKAKMNLTVLGEFLNES